jgi:prepilin-type N-terminal cleavage/methylation domain-containing protein
VKRAFTLIELLMVVAIIAVLAAIAVPNFLEAKIRTSISRVASDHRTLATGIEAYHTDHKQYPPSATAGQGFAGATHVMVLRNPTGRGNVNFNLPGLGDEERAQLGSIWSFAARGATAVAQLTTPVAYITSLTPDPFMDTKGATSGYFATRGGWVLWSPGPDMDQATGTNTGTNVIARIVTPHVAGPSTVETLYDVSIPQPSWHWRATSNGIAITFDATNGSISRGDLIRFKQ